MKNHLATACGVLLLLTVAAWSQNDSVAAAAQQNQQKKASHVIDDDNLSSAVANGGDVQNASATTAPEPDKEAKEDKVISELANRDEKAATPKGEVERQKTKEKNWLNTIEVCKNKLANAQSDMQRDIWTENLASAEDGLSKTRKDLANAEQVLQEEEQNQPAPPAASSDQTSGSTSDQSGGGSSPQ